MPFRDTMAQPGRGVPPSVIPAFLCLALLFISRNLFAYQLRLDPQMLAPGLGQAAGHYLLAVVFSIPLCVYLRSPGKKTLSLRIAAAFLLLAGAVATLGYFHQATGIGLYVPPVLLGACFALFFPFTVSLFFAFIPTRRLGVCFGLAMAAGEFIWLLALPSISAGGPVTTAASFISHLQAMQGLVHCAMGALLAYLLVNMRDNNPEAAAGLTPDHQKSEGVQPAASLPDSTPPGDAPPDKCAPPPERQKRQFLVSLFCISALLLFLFGIGLGTPFPKAAHRPALADPLHYLMIISLPLVGILLDKGRAGCGVLLALLAVCAFSVPLEVFGGSQGPNGEFTPLLFMGRESLQLCLFTQALLLSQRFFLPLAGSLAYAMYLAPFAGGLYAASPAFVANDFLPGQTVTLGLAAVFAIAAAALFFRALRSPAIWSRDFPTTIPVQNAAQNHGAVPQVSPQAAVAGQCPPDGGSPAQEEPKLSAFAVTFGLSKRELQVLDGIIRDQSPEGIADKLGVRESTIRFHQTGLFKKTGQPNRRLLALFFQTWSPE